MIKFDTTDAIRLKKIGIIDFFDLAITAPNNYEDRRISDSIDTNRSKVYKAVVEGIKDSVKFVSFKLSCSYLGITIEAIFFNKTPYLKAQFPQNKEVVIYGKLVQTGYGYQIIHPKLVAANGKITPIYKVAIRSDIFAKIISKYITIENLTETRMPKNICDAIYKMHHPNDSSENDYEENLSRHSIEALKFTELYAFIHKFSTKRSRFPAKPLERKECHIFINTLPFKPTNSQLEAFKAIAHDLVNSAQTRRIVIGDVGSGKTVVIAFACYFAHPKKSIILAPTSILAEQLATEVKRFLPKIQNIRLLTQKNNLTDEEIDDADILVGTHALLYKSLPTSSVVIVDEQHRFGSSQRALIEKLTTDGVFRPHYLQFSATPIPRTQAMVNSALIDVSLMTDLPFAKNIDTKVASKSDFGEILDKIKDETNNDRQVVIVYPLVEESESIEYMSIEEGAPFWQSRFDSVYVTHGKDKAKEDVLSEFAKHGKILIATTLIEVGVSLPNLSTIVIVGAERLGLATLHQLRGRVSRNGLKGYCFLYTNNVDNERLKEFSKTTSGFDIAELDLKYRNAGDLLGGVQQSGKVFKWFDYAKDEKVASCVKSYFEKV